VTTAERTAVDELRYPINVAARRSGLTAHVIRAWERRYTAVRPERGDTQRRLYSDHEVQRLVLLRQAVELGHRIGEIAQLPMEQLRVLVGREAVAGVEASPRIPLGPSRLVDTALEAIRAMDTPAFTQSMLQATRSLSVPQLFESFITPLMASLGHLWETGVMRVAHEHFASAHLRTFLGDLLASASSADGGRVIVVTTPHGQHHELGALISAVAAARCGWTVVYLGPSLPAEEIAFAVEMRRARALALSISYPTDDARLPQQLINLRRLLPEQVPIFVGGQALPAYRDALDAIGPLEPDNLQGFVKLLQGLDE